MLIKNCITKIQFAIKKVRDNYYGAGVWRKEPDTRPSPRMLWLSGEMGVPVCTGTSFFLLVLALFALFPAAERGTHPGVHSRSGIVFMV
jgi:hypothetical protein